jgi:hypothetical protein
VRTEDRQRTSTRHERIGSMHPAPSTRHDPDTTHARDQQAARRRGSERAAG